MSKMYGRYMRAHRQLSSEMPLRKYFLFVGGTLLTLLLAANWFMPRPASNALTNSDVKLPIIRIHSDRKGPEAVVMDTSKFTTAKMLAREYMVVPQAVIPSESGLDEALAHPYAPLRPHADGNDQKKTREGQQQTSRRILKADLERRAMLSHRPSPAHFEPVAMAALSSGMDFTETFAQFVPRSQFVQRSMKQPRRVKR